MVLQYKISAAIRVRVAFADLSGENFWIDTGAVVKNDRATHMARKYQQHGSDQGGSQLSFANRGFSSSPTYDRHPSE